MTRDEKTAYRRHHVEGFQESGLLVRAYAEREAVAVSSLNYWRKRVGSGRVAGKERFGQRGRRRRNGVFIKGSSHEVEKMQAGTC
ncbi:MAG: IS66 family insertion sequence element accessory protein TnpA [Acidiferrobacter sp.]